MPEKIMVIDDEPDIIFLLRDFFTLNDYEVITADNAEEAMEKLKENPDLILLDINMPGRNGLEFCKRVRSHTQCPIIFLSARTREEDILNGLNIGGDDYITKPFHIKELLARVQAHLRREKRNKDIAEVNGNGLKIDYSGRSVSFDGASISFTKTEFEIIEFLSMNPGQIFNSCI